MLLANKTSCFDKFKLYKYQYLMKVKERIKAKIEDELSPHYLELVDESAQHNVPRGAESHFRLTIASDFFHGMAKVKRHQCIYNILSEELSGPVHALALHIYSMKEWGEREGLTPRSPACMGGERKVD